MVSPIQKISLHRVFPFHAISLPGPGISLPMVYPSPEHLPFMAVALSYGISLTKVSPLPGYLLSREFPFPAYLPSRNIFSPWYLPPQDICLTTVSPSPGFLHYLRYLPPISISLPSTNFSLQVITNYRNTIDYNMLAVH